jgi:hypothetical protein
MASLFSSVAGKIQTFAGFLNRRDGIPFLISGRENPNLYRFFEQKGCYPFDKGQREWSMVQRAKGKERRTEDIVRIM